MVKRSRKRRGQLGSQEQSKKIFTAKLDPKLHIKKAILKDNGKSVDILWSDLKKPINYSSNFFLGKFK